MHRLFGVRGCCGSLDKISIVAGTPRLVPNTLDKSAGYRIIGVVGAWPLDEALATDLAVDYSGNGNNGTPTGTTIIDGPFVGKKARSFNGSTDIIVFNNAVNALVRSESFGVFVKPSSLGFIFGITAGDRVWFNIHAESGGKYNLRIYFSGLSVAATYSDYLIEPEAWLFIGYIYDVVTNTVYVIVNSIEVSSVKTGTRTSPGLNIRFLGSNVVLSYFNGGICSACFFNTAISTEKMMTIGLNYPDVKLDAGKVILTRNSKTSLDKYSTLNKHRVD